MTFLQTLIPNDITDAGLFLALGGAAAMLIAMAKAGFGGSVGLLATPMMVIACGAGNTALALGILLPILMLCDLVSAIIWWRQWNWRAVWMLLPGAVVGIAAGWVTMYLLLGMGLGGEKKLAAAWMQLGIAAICLSFVAMQIYRYRSGKQTPFRPVLWQGTCVGVAAGFTSMMAHAAGPITSMYLLSQRMTKGTFVASTVLYFWIGNALKLGPYWQLGQVNPATLRAGVLFVPAVVVGTVAGRLLHRLVGEKQFTLVVYTLLALAGGHLAYSALTVLRGG